jgi:predicted AlkP superfamily phosphohydrolase/phosphomutase
LKNKLGVRFLNATRRRSPTFLRLLSVNGVKVGSVGIPTTYPPENLSGFQISGFDSPLPSKADRSYVNPPELADDLDRDLGGYYFGNFNEGRINKGWHNRVLIKLLDGLARKAQIMSYLIKRYSLDLFLLHIGETDTVGHHFWALCDPQSPRYVDPEDKRLADAIKIVYCEADRLIGEALEIANPESVMVVSDHGMGGTSDRLLYINNYLEANGLLKRSNSKVSSRLAGMLKHIGMRWIPYRWQQAVFHLAKGKIASNLESWQRYGGIDWENTYAFSEELNYFPSIWLNIHGRDPFGQVDPATAEEVIQSIKQALLNWNDPIDDVPIVKHVYRREELYRGSELEFAPDLIIDFHKPNGYSYALARSDSGNTKDSFRVLEPHEYLGFKGGSMNGSHRSYGTMILQTPGESLTAADIPDLCDIAPTVLHLLDLDRPDWMDGQSLIKGQRVREDQFKKETEAEYSQQQEDKLRKRLTELGYLR